MPQRFFFADERYKVLDIYRDIDLVDKYEVSYEQVRHNPGALTGWAQLPKLDILTRLEYYSPNNLEITSLISCFELATRTNREAHDQSRVHEDRPNVVRCLAS